MGRGVLENEKGSIIKTVRELFDPVDLLLPRLPGELEGLRIAQVSDLHIRGRRRRHERIIREIRGLDVDLILLTGDYMCWPGDEAVALEVMKRMVGEMKARLGVYGVFGNHDSQEVQEMCEALPVRWMHNECRWFEGLPMVLLGFGSDRYGRPDSVELVRNSDQWSVREGQANRAKGLGGEKMISCPVSGGRSPESTVQSPEPKVKSPESKVQGREVGEKKVFRVLMSHYPTYLPTAADMGMDLVFSGHTHGGQMRLPWKCAVYNSIDLPLHLTTGILKHKGTVCAVSRGLGETYVQLRMFCPPHLPVYTLRRGEMFGAGGEHMECARGW